MNEALIKSGQVQTCWVNEAVWFTQLNKFGHVLEMRWWPEHKFLAINSGVCVGLAIHFSIRMDYSTTTFNIGPLYGRYFSQFALLVWSKEELFLRDNHKKCHMQWPMKDLLDAGYELSSITESLRQVSLGEQCSTKVNIGVDVTLSVSQPIPLVVIKTDYASTMFMTTWDELYQMYGSHIEHSILMEGFVCNTSLMHAVYVDSNRLNW